MGKKIMNQIKLGDILGKELEEDFTNFDLTDIQKILGQLGEVDAIDLAHAEFLQQQSLRAADILSEYLGKVIKTVAYLETKINSTKNKVALEYKAEDGVRTTADMKKWAGESSTEVETISIKLAKAKGSKSILEKKYDIAIRSHHNYKDIAAGLRRGILGHSGSQPPEKVTEGWE